MLKNPRRRRWLQSDYGDTTSLSSSTLTASWDARRGQCKLGRNSLDKKDPLIGKDGRVTVILQGRRADMEYLRVEYSWPKTATIFGQQSWKGHAVCVPRA